MYATIFLKKNEETRLKEGHPWVFSSEVDKIKGYFVSGDLVEVRAFNNEFIGIGYVNTASKIWIRLLTRNEEIIDEDFFLGKIREANDLKKMLGFENNYRVVFAEADFLPGLIIDKYGDYLVAQFLTLGMDKRKDLIISALVKIFNPLGIYERSDVDVRLKEGLEKIKEVRYGNVPESIEIIENGIKLNIDIINGQKTGYFLDQKKNRLFLQNISYGKDVLDCFSNVGGFGLNALKGGAKNVTFVDISKRACEEIERNAKLNNFINYRVLCEDVFNYLKTVKEEFDIVVLDPPAFTKTKEKKENAYKGYKEINSLGIKLVKNHGILISCSCSEHMDRITFLSLFKEINYENNYHLKLIGEFYQSFDHPRLIGADENLYLKCLVFEVVK